MMWYLVFGGVFCAWSMLTIVGGERTRLLREREQAAKESAENTEPEAPIVVGDKS
jgi:hypothetical protein